MYSHSAVENCACQYNERCSGTHVGQGSDRLHSDAIEIVADKYRFRQFAGNDRCQMD